jgi:hypothetical protein
MCRDVNSMLNRAVLFMSRPIIFRFYQPASNSVHTSTSHIDLLSGTTF